MEEKKCILIVEDERAIVEILKFNLKREGYDTLEALDGEAGLELARTEDPDLILLDVMLPKMNGFDICKNLREAGSSVPIIMLTAREEETDKVAGELNAQGIRVEVDARSEKIGKKIREATLGKIPYMLVVGDRDIENETVSVRTRGGEDLGAMSRADFAARVLDDVKTKRIW